MVPRKSLQSLRTKLNIQNNKTVQSLKNALGKALSDHEDLEKNYPEYLKCSSQKISSNQEWTAKETQNKKFKIITVEEGATLTLKNLELDCAILHVKGKLILDNCKIDNFRVKIHKEGVIEAKNSIIQASTQNIFGKLTGSLGLQADELVIGKDAKIETSQLDIKAVNLLNQGKLEAAENLHIQTDYLMNWGHVKCPQLKLYVNRTAFNAGFIDSNEAELNVVSILNLWRIHAPKKLTINSIFGLSPGVIQSNLSTLNILFKGPFACVPAMPENIDDIINWQSISTGIMQALMVAIPALSAPLTFFNVSKNLVQQLNDFSRLSHIIEKYHNNDLSISDVLPFMTQLFNVAVSGYSAGKQANRLYESVGNLDTKNFSFDSLWQQAEYSAHTVLNADAKAVSKEALTILGPKVTSNTIINIKGAELAASIQESNVYSRNVGLQAGVNIITHDAYKGENNGKMYAVDVVQTGGEVVNNNAIHATSYTAIVDKFTTTSESSVDATHTDLTYQEIAHEGKISTRSLAQKSDHIPQAQELIDGKHTDRFDVKEKLTLASKDNFVITDSARRDVNLDVTGTNVQIETKLQQDKSYRFKTTEGALKVTKDQQTKQLELESAKEFVNTVNLHADVLAVESQENVVNHRQIHGRVTHVKGKNVINESKPTDGELPLFENKVGASIKGSKYLEVKAKEKILNLSHAHNFSPYLCYVSNPNYVNVEAVMEGGDDPVGAIFHAEDVVENQYGTMTAKGKTVIVGEKGVKMKPHTHNRIENYSHKDNLFKEKESYDLVPKVFRPKVSSENSTVEIISNGKVYTEAAQIESHNGATIHGKEVELDELTTARQRVSHKNHCGKTSDFHGVYQGAVPTKVKNEIPGVTQIIGEESVRTVGAELDLPGYSLIAGKKVYLGQRNKSSEVIEFKKGMRFTGLGMGESAMPNFTPELISDLQNLSGGEFLEDDAMNVASAAFSAVNTAFDLKEAIASDNLLQAIAGQMGISPNAVKVKLELYQTIKHTYYETKGGGHLNTDKLDIIADEAEIDGIPVSVTGDATVYARKFTQRGTELKSSISQSRQSANTEVTPTGKTFSVSDSKDRVEQSIFHNQIMMVGGKFTLRAQEWNRDGANVFCDSHDIDAETINEHHHANTLRHRSKQTSVSTASGVSHAKSKLDKSTISNFSGLFSNTEKTQDNYKVGKENVTSDAEYDKSSHAHLKIPANVLDFKKRVESLMSDMSTSGSQGTSHLQVLKEVIPGNALEKTMLTHRLSSLVYQADLGQGILNNLGVKLVDSYHDESTDSHVAVYQKDDSYYISFQGTNSVTAMLTDDVDIFSNKNPSSVNKNMIQFVKSTMEKHPNKEFTLTGHSRGAAQASVISSKLNVPAIVFENPGVNKSNNLTKVVSIQSIPNVLNQGGNFFNKNDYGHSINLSPSLKDKMFDLAAGMFKAANKNVWSQFLAVLVETKNSHSLEELKQRMRFLNSC